MKNLFTDLFPAILVIIASVIELIVQSRQLKNLREELEGTKAIIKDTADLRNAILHNLEGTWSLVGSFTKFQNDCAQHNSEGFLILSWSPGKRCYDAIYCYSVCKAGQDETLVTAVCQGYSVGDVDHDNSTSLSLMLRVISRTDLHKKVNYNKTFTLEIKLNRSRKSSRINKMSSNFETPATVGTLDFSKMN